MLQVKKQKKNSRKKELWIGWDSQQDYDKVEQKLLRDLMWLKHEGKVSVYLVYVSC